MTVTQPSASMTINMPRVSRSVWSVAVEDLEERTGDSSGKRDL